MVFMIRDPMVKIWLLNTVQSCNFFFQNYELKSISVMCLTDCFGKMSIVNIVVLTAYQEIVSTGLKSFKNMGLSLKQKENRTTK